MKNSCLIIFLFLYRIAFGQDYFLFAGSYTGPEGGKGIYVYKFSSSSGKLQWISNTEGIINPSFITLSPDGKYVYACTETKMKDKGSVSAFSFNRKNGQLKFINKQPSGGENPVYLSVHKSGKWLVNGNYTGGSTTVFPINNGGSVQPYSQLIQYADSSVNKERQEAAHVHATVFSPDFNRLFVTDLGADKIRNYSIGASSKQPLEKSELEYTASVPGSGPRHLTFHPGGKYAYAIEEMSGTVSVYAYENGRLNTLQRIAAHDSLFKGPYASADIHVSPDGKFLYASNRSGENNISIFSIDALNGKLSYVNYQSTLGDSPRNFIIDPNGNYLIVANVTSGNIVVFKRNKETGLLQPNGVQVKVKNPSCLQLVKAGN